jgi:single-strand DNA-binding protein
MASLNKVMLIGNLTRDPEVRFTPKGSAVCDMAIAVNRRYLNENTGERVEEVTYLDIVLWNKQAELAGQYLSKGRSVYIEGRLQMDTWEDKATGQKRSKIRIVCENMQFLSGPGGGGGGPSGAGASGGYQGGDDEGGYSSPPPQQQQARRPAGNGGGGGGYQRPAPAQQRPPQRPAPAQQQDDFGEGPITDGLEGDDIPF